MPALAMSVDGGSYGDPWRLLNACSCLLPPLCRHRLLYMFWGFFLFYSAASVKAAAANRRPRGWCAASAAVRGLPVATS